MIIKRLNIINFKSIASVSLELSDKVNCFVGLNGMGKTNILDSLHYLSFTKSHLGTPDSLVVRKGAEACILDATYMSSHGDERNLLLQIYPGQRKILKRNKKEYERLSDHIGNFPLVIISPQDYQLIQGGGEERRRFVDMQLSQQDPAYMNALSMYNKVLSQRNTLLKDYNLSDSLLDILDQQLDRYANYIWQKRRQFVELFTPHFSSYYSAIDQAKDSIALKYSSQLNDNQGDLLTLLSANRQRDKVLGYTTYGIHRDDLEMTLAGDPIKRVGSQGQSKTFLVSLKLAQYRMLCEQQDEQPMLLLDDIFDKLDAKRVERIISIVGGEDFGQIFMTDTNRSHLDKIIQGWGEDYHLYEVQNGNIEQIMKV